MPSTTEILALALAGVVIPLLQERLAGAAINGAVAAWVNFAACFFVSLFATFATTGFADAPDLGDPVATLAFYGARAGAVIALSKIVFTATVKPITRTATI